MNREKITPSKVNEKIDLVSEISRENISDCMQCGKCTAGCPASHGMDILPHQVLRFLQLGEVDKLLSSETIWICASCFTCASRCPRDVDLAKIMEGLRLVLLRAKGNDKLKLIDVAQKVDGKIPQQAIVSIFRKYRK